MTPQWSPPLSSGMTREQAIAGPALNLPQWSPPLSSGMTSNGITDALLKLLPQWSPPLSSGMTLSAPWRRILRYAAAMEPAAQQRDDCRSRRRG